jgi:hypothetical protein
MDPPDFPHGCLVQSVYVDDEGIESGWRIFADGRHESRRASAPWERLAPLDLHQVDQVRRALAASDLDRHAGVHGSLAHAPRRGVLWFQTDGRDAPALIALVGGAPLPAMERFNAGVFEILAGSPPPGRPAGP